MEGKRKQHVVSFHSLEPGNDIGSQKREGPPQVEMAVHIGVRHVHEEAWRVTGFSLEDVSIFPPLLPFSFNLRIHDITLKVPLQK